MTVDEIAAMLGVTVRALQVRKSRIGDVSYQLMANMYRENQFQSRGDRYPRHLVDGEWITTREAARRVGVSVHTIVNYMYVHKNGQGQHASLEEAIRYYRQYQTGERKRYKGSPPKTHVVNGCRMTVKQAAKRYKITPNVLYTYMSKHRCSLDTTVKRLEDRRMRKAEKDIMAILMENDHERK